MSENGDYEINANDADLDLHFISGGGTFHISHDDGSIRTDGPFTLVKEEEHRMELTLEDGEASVDIQSDDSEVRLSVQ